MMIRTLGVSLLLAAVGAGDALAQAAPPAPPKLQIETPTYVVIPMEITVDRPAAEVWRRVGKFCDIGEWLQIPSGCKIISGRDGEVGAVRSVAHEVLVGKTALSYTYTQPVYEGRPYNLYHGTLEARPTGPRTSKLIYTLMYDNSLVTGDATTKQAEVDRRRQRFQAALVNMKTLAEGGSLPPRSAPHPGAPSPK